jgi:hypothetical protein
MTVDYLSDYIGRQTVAVRTLPPCYPLCSLESFSILRVVVTFSFLYFLS